MTNFWAPTPNINAYTNLLKAAYPAIKSADQNATVITGGLASADNAPNQIEQLTFLRGIYQAGGKNFFDAVGHHPYSIPAPASSVQPWSGWSKMGDTEVSMRSIMTENGDGAKLIWATEYGAATNGPGAIATRYGYNPLSDPDHADEDWQATFAHEAVAYVKQHPWLGPMMWYSYKDLGTDAGNTENFFGMLRADGSHKPVYDIFRHDLAR